MQKNVSKSWRFFVPKFKEGGASLCKKLLKCKDLAEQWSLSEDRIYTLAREGIIPSIRIGRTLRFSPTAIEEFISNGGKALPGVWKREP